MLIFLLQTNYNSQLHKKQTKKQLPIAGLFSLISIGNDQQKAASQETKIFVPRLIASDNYANLKKKRSFLSFYLPITIRRLSLMETFCFSITDRDALKIKGRNKTVSHTPIPLPDFLNKAPEEAAFAWNAWVFLSLGLKNRLREKTLNKKLPNGEPLFLLRWDGKTYFFKIIQPWAVEKLGIAAEKSEQDIWQLYTDIFRQMEKSKC